jgi:hypothetical protein
MEKVSCWSFYIINDNNIIDGSKPQIMSRCMISHINFNLRINLERRGIITYYQKTNITTLKKHVDADHVMLAKGFEEEMNSPLKQLVIKRPNVFNSKISEFFGAKDPFKKDVVQQKKFLQDLAFLVAKNHLPIQIS